ncbi:hypothetical protein I7I53_12174 [Histoplasma capsulatum var. duboisii H88]|uniref:Uncharacterized protein n=2 Tax=Ajellomyces capsulatus TaxID=5037 RepID=A0A8H8D420_AJECA|nr:hypothetical protein I7I52_10836 [Histoplasma capsulatum]QSS57861.1 hypothetical protein I7I53_12174 [Histoplasma capsulatum var. duboisii H88]QSS68767.1 hypothetical protein I7I50_09847 [Histoplasma capsulatum G186AR]
MDLFKLFVLSCACPSFFLPHTYTDMSLSFSYSTSISICSCPYPCLRTKTQFHPQRLSTCPSRVAPVPLSSTPEGYFISQL